MVKKETSNIYNTECNCHHCNETYHDLANLRSHLDYGKDGLVINRFICHGCIKAYEEIDIVFSFVS
mgnify:CR=1 FL=1